MTADSIRIYILAKQQNTDIEVLVREAQRLGLDISNALSTVTREQSAMIIDSLRRKPPEAPPLGICSNLLPRGPRPGAAHQQLLPPEDEMGGSD